MNQNLTYLRIYLILLISMLFIVPDSNAQNTEELVPRVSYWEFGFSSGLSKFVCSRNPNADAVYSRFNYWDSKLNLGVSLFAIKHISPVFSLEFDYLKTGVSGSWNANNGYPVPVNVAAQGLSNPPPFKTGINQFSALLNANLNKLFFPKLAGDIWHLYFNGGAGYCIVKDKKGFDILGGSKTKGMVLYGPGVSVKINKNINGLAGFTRYIVYTDHLDALSTFATDAYGNMKAEMHVNERYNYSYIGITYRFDQRVRKPGKSSTPYYKTTDKRSTILSRFFKHIF